jgi:hypothetical protein
MRAGVSFRDWQVMSRWQVKDIAVRHKMVTGHVLKEIDTSKDKLSSSISAVVSRILGI